MKPNRAKNVLAAGNVAVGHTTIICQIESEEGLANREAIVSTPGVDCL